MEGNRIGDAGCVLSYVVWKTNEMYGLPDVPVFVLDSSRGYCQRPFRSDLTHVKCCESFYLRFIGTNSSERRTRAL